MQIGQDSKLDQVKATGRFGLGFNSVRRIYSQSMVDESPQQYLVLYNTTSWSKMGE